MAVRHLGELKKKKSYRARAKVEIHESSYVVGVHFSQAPESWRPANLRKVAARIPGAGQPPPPTASRRGRRPGNRRTLARVRRALAWHLSGARFHPGTFKKQTSRIPGHLRESHERKMRPPPPAPASAHAPPPSCTQTGAENAGTGPPPPPGSTAPGEGASAGLGLPARPAPAAAHTCRCSPPCPGPALRRAHGRPAPFRSADENPRRRRSSP